MPFVENYWINDWAACWQPVWGPATYVCLMEIIGRERNYEWTDIFASILVAVELPFLQLARKIVKVILDLQRVRQNTV